MKVLSEVPATVQDAITSLKKAHTALEVARDELVVSLKGLEHHQMVEAVMFFYWGNEETVWGDDILAVSTCKLLVGANSTPQFHKLAEHYRPLKSIPCETCRKPFIAKWSRHQGWTPWNDECGSCRDKEVMQRRREHNEAVDRRISESAS